MATHTKYSLRCSGIAKILNLPFAISASETSRTKSLIPRKDCQILNLVSTCCATVCALVTDQGAIGKQKKVGIWIQQSATSIASEAVNVPAVICWGVKFVLELCKVRIMQSGQVSQILTELKCFAFLKYLQDNLVNQVTARKSLPKLGYILLHIPYTDTKHRHHSPKETQAQGIPWFGCCSSSRFTTSFWL